MTNNTGWFKGHNWGECLKCGKSHKHYNLGKHLSKETKIKISNSEIGKTISEEHKAILRKRMLNDNVAKKPEIRLKIKFAKMGTRPTKDAIKASIEYNKIHFKGKGNPFYGKKHTQETREIIKKKRLEQVFPKKDTKPEKMMQLALTLHGIRFEKHKKIIGQPDIFIEPDICIFIDGCYHHACQEHFPDVTKFNEMQIQNSIRDNRINHELNKLGYSVIRIWSHDIEKDSNEVSKKIFGLIQKLEKR